MLLDSLAHFFTSSLIQSQGVVCGKLESPHQLTLFGVISSITLLLCKHEVCFYLPEPVFYVDSVTYHVSSKLLVLII